MDSQDKNTQATISFFSAYAKMWKNYAVFKGRATRSEFWKAAAIHLVIIVVFLVLPITFMILGHTNRGDDSLFVTGLFALGLIYFCASFFPYLGLMVRRLHDIGLSGGLLLLVYLAPLPLSFAFPGVSLIVSFLTKGLTLLLFCKDSDRGTNIYGEPAKYPNKQDVKTTEKISTPENKVDSSKQNNISKTVPIAKFCPFCGSKLVENASFCSSCGAEIRS